MPLTSGTAILLSLYEFKYSKYLTVTKYLREINSKEEGLFWLMISEI
jgi:hypothetical protein